MPGIYTRRKIKALRERGKRMAAARWAKDRARREAEMPDRIRELAEIEIENLPRRQGDALGCLQWTDYRSGKVRRWVLRIGDRSDRFTVEIPGGQPGKSRGWTSLLARLRHHLVASA
jgi:hypothetical protein